MKVWLLRFEDTYHCENEISAFASEDEALRAAVFGIMNEINSNWNLCDSDTLTVALEIDRLVSQKKWTEALVAFNEESSESDHGIYFTVWDQEVENFTDTPDRLCLDGLPNNNAPATNSFPLDQGATCRNCGTTNEYAVPDQSDMTYVCRQCSTFKSIFS